jgi:exopolyphosphatase/guanosine-5'-triphosphate,3'-diphosphate pyrophosphatase
MDAYRLREDRADVIVPASKIFLFIMKAINVRQVTAPKIGVADGLIVELYRGMQQ